MKQQQVWDNIAKEWFEFKIKPARHVEEFLKNKTGKILDLGSGAGRHLMKLGSHRGGERFSETKVLGAGGNGLRAKSRIGRGTELGSHRAGGRGTAPAPKTKMYLVDFSEKMIKLAKKRAKEKNIDAEFAVADLEKLPYENNFFDYAIAVASLHCLEPKKQKKAIKELFRVLKKGGQAEITVWNKQAKRFKNAPKEKFIAWRDKGRRYYYFFDEKEIHDLFKKAGFKIKEKIESEINIDFIAEKPL